MEVKDYMKGILIRREKVNVLDFYDVKLGVHYSFDPIIPLIYMLNIILLIDHSSFY